jgi:cytoskeletal protein CcmA (bactofilin family)
MASTFTGLGTELMTTGENAGTWGTKTNTNLSIVEQISGGYIEQSIAGSADTTTLSVSDGSAGAVLAHRIIKFTGTITGNQIVTIPLDVQQLYVLVNGTSGAYTVQFKYASGSGSSVTFAATDKGSKLVYATADDATNPNLVDSGIASTGDHDLDGQELILDADGDTSITADTDDQIDIKIGGADDFQFTANTFTAQSGSSIVVPDGGLTFGSTAITSTAAELNLLDGVSGLVQADLTKLAALDATAAELNIVDGGTSATSTTVADADRVVLNDNGTMVQVAVTDLAAYFDDEITAMPNLTSVGTLTTLTVDSIIINGTNIGHTSDADALAIDSSGNVTASQNLVVTGDLTVSGDDITMGTNTAGNLLVADGTNFNSIAVSSLSEISTAASDDVFIAIDTSGGGLKKIARSAVVAGLATDSAISNLVEDTSPQLGGNLDTNSANILIDDAHFIADENGNEQIIFQTTSSAVNQFDVTNAATGNPPSIKATGGDSNIDFNISAKGTGHVTVLGDTNSGAIQFNCESNSHGQQIKAQPHSAGVTNVMLLPAGADSTLVSLVSTDTLTNKTLTSPKINEDVAVTSTATELNILDGVTATTAEINLIDGGTARGTTAVADADGILHNDGGTMRMTSAATFKTYFTSGVSSAADDLTAGDSAVTITTSSGDITIDAAANDSDIILKGTDGGVDTTFLTIDGSAAGAATFNDKIIATELDISGNCDIDGTTNLDAVDIDGAVQLDATLTIGANDQGYDVILYGDTASANITWDTSADDLIFNGAAGLIIPDGQLTLGSTAVTSTAAELNLLDGVSGLVQADLTKLAAVDSTAAELNIVDGGTSATSTTVADADRVVLNDNGTMVQVAMTDIKTYIGGGTSWQAVKTGDFTAAAGQGVFCNTTSAAFTLTLPAGSIGDEVSFVDYAGTFDSNNLTIASNGSEKIHGSTDNLTIAVERAANTLVFTDSTQGWLLKSK